jgi:hypothetical protein
MRIDEAARLLAGSDALVAMRLHGVLLGHAHGVPLLALEYDGKVRALGDDLGLPSLQRMPLDAIAARLPDALRRLTADPSSFVTVPRARSDALARDALAHRDLLHAAMRGAPLPPPTRAPLLPRWLEALDAPGRERVLRALLARLDRAARG